MNKSWADHQTCLRKTKIFRIELSWLIRRLPFCCLATNEENAHHHNKLRWNNVLLFVRHFGGWIKHEFMRSVWLIAMWALYNVHCIRLWDQVIFFQAEKRAESRESVSWRIKTRPCTMIIDQVIGSFFLKSMDESTMNRLKTWNELRRTTTRKKIDW